MKKQWMIVVIVTIMVAGYCGSRVCEAKKTEPAQQQVPPQIKIYDGEITDEMIDSFLRADAKIRSLRQQITKITEQVLSDENIKAEVYMAVAQKMRQDPDFLEKVRTAAAAMVAENAPAAEAKE